MLAKPTIIGYRKNGSPIWLVQGGSEPLPPTTAVPPPGPAPVPTIATTSTNLPAAPPTGQYFTAEQLEAARQQEKDKLYDRLQKQQQQLDAFATDVEQWKAEREAAQKKAAEEAAARAEAEKKAAEAKMSAEELITARQKELDDTLAKFRQEMETKQALMDREHQFLSLQAYTQRRVAEEVAANTIADEFLDYIDGKTEAEVEASITKAKEKTASIVAATFGQQKPAPTVTPGVSPTGFGPTGPLETISGTREYTPEQIRNMDSAEFAAYRKAIGLDKAGKDKGMFG